MISLADLPHVNAVLNALSAGLAVSGWVAIRWGRRRRAHAGLMLGALASSAAFLACYLVYHFHHGSTRFPGGGGARVLYFAILLTHTVLAAAIVPLIGVTIWRAARSDFVKHVRIARVTLPIWVYVNVTGVVIYWMLYRMEWPAP